MAFDAYDDYEQSERVQKWLRENGLSIAVGIAIGLVGIFGLQQWRKHQANSEAAAATLYQQADVAIASGKPDAATAFVDELMKDYAKSPYALFAVSDRAKQQVQDKQFDKAIVSLQWAAAHAASPALKSLVQLRMARVQLAKGDGQAALATLEAMPAGDYTGLNQELRGDALVKLGRADDARRAYQAAMAALGEDAPQHAVLQMKIDDLAVAGKQGA
ncbi:MULTISPECIES: YfgM family protein [Rhodanobacter]|uniref:Ancillary SecYEG translocon subunit n=1 Tax=Rhodanobacter hydrolyticus TaxID=2250595 RepID=A0ABW8JEB8_9GAMM|nr:tetratricopeptide repeat protein [Rhodanobacter sp. 7MK24]MBD8880741.1 tetratricopeptide repeat protein [Rhodanobacter sp. 7MK24]